MHPIIQDLNRRGRLSNEELNRVSQMKPDRLLDTIETMGRRIDICMKSPALYSEGYVLIIRHLTLVILARKMTLPHEHVNRLLAQRRQADFLSSYLEELGNKVIEFVDKVRERQRQQAEAKAKEEREAQEASKQSLSNLKDSIHGGPADGNRGAGAVGSADEPDELELLRREFAGTGAAGAGTAGAAGATGAAGAAGTASAAAYPDELEALRSEFSGMNTGGGSPGGGSAPGNSNGASFHEATTPPLPPGAGAAGLAVDPAHGHTHSHSPGSGTGAGAGVAAVAAASYATAPPPADGPVAVTLPEDLIRQFEAFSQAQLSAGIESCAVLALPASALPAPGSNHGGPPLRVTHMIFPEQEGTQDQCVTLNELSLFEYVSSQDLVVCGWIHSHPSQPLMLSSIDLHMHFSYQVSFPQAIAIVFAPTCPSGQRWGVFQLTPKGMAEVGACRVSPSEFHHHTSPPSELFRQVLADTAHGGDRVVVKDLRH
ncbi:hypothetical protein H696_01858 [Fonticula alba]|uniref:MPN domain-containing protein n=1 Tax=Fonticula alba TaxID=691883 RepID=A0A058ZBV9_FONAL|nr:hypothetical protein H696_01858 [Fonticula alba]KCV70912.1 hypothetical protein H696_01858 [Fonticula alba]|eukprot:XP_009494035.1 hypothetical protein H696_01858 [Fonticula alba]